MRWTIVLSAFWSSILAFANRVAGLPARLRTMHGFFLSLSNRLKNSPSRKSTTVPGKVSARTAVVKSRPLSLEDRYRPLADTNNLDEMFLRMRERLYGAADELSAGERGSRRPRVVLREAGRIGPKRPYFFLKPMSEIGWLFERSGNGWVVSRAEKIVGKDTFLRRGEPWDIVTLHEATSGSNTIRVTSQRIGGALIPFSVYESKLGAEMFDLMAPTASTSDSLNDYLTGD